MRPPRDSSPEAALAEGFAHHVRQWALAQGAGADTAAGAARAAQALSLATSAGHVCLALAELGDATTPAERGGPADATAWRTTLMASGVVGTPDLPGGRPLILDDEDRLYLHRHFDLERRLAQRLVRCAAPLPRCAPARRPAWPAAPAGWGAKPRSASSLATTRPSSCRH